eukprot:CAMPEP_0194331348 /NCGR_PEP_ID=MMETSP0171-20130528/55271_1 /TAXON_ID=218684 /ORGANISM="Corethron pennatum, Strain L29A3" /LENGTH=47 /DNA_ID= /DNA_START= /DNA_END= /DNA_ORIENTATION=
MKETPRVRLKMRLTDISRVHVKKILKEYQMDCLIEIKKESLKVELIK